MRTDLREELGFLALFDRAFEAVRAVVDMPDRRAGLLIRLMLQNGGRLSRAKRPQFAELSDQEIEAMEDMVQAAIASERDETGLPCRIDDRPAKSHIVPRIDGNSLTDR